MTALLTVVAGVLVAGAALLIRRGLVRHRRWQRQAHLANLRAQLDCAPLSDEEEALYVLILAGFERTAPDRHRPPQRP